MSSYKQMLRDRMPATLSLALKWCKAKERWIDYVYERFIKKQSKQGRSKMVKAVLGLLPAYNADDIRSTFAMFGMVLKKPIPNEKLYLDFRDTLDLSLEGSDVEYWKYVNSWVVWFQQHMAYISNSYINSKRLDRSDEYIHADIKSNYCGFLSEPWDDKLATYIIKYLEENV